jgi:hypothetical protein
MNKRATTASNYSGVGGRKIPQKTPIGVIALNQDRINGAVS